VKAILIANPKGGSGKTTLSTNIAGHLALRGQRVAILDLDRQKSATQWLANRPRNLSSIELMHSEAEKNSPVDWLVIDSPAGLHGKNLDHALKLVHKVIVPIAPSAFDIQASRDFMEVLHPRTRAALTLEQFLKGLDLPVLAYLREAQVYVNAAFEGKTLFDLPPSLAGRELEQWAYLLNWLDQSEE
jgi:chromosome partitioning protein